MAEKQSDRFNIITYLRIIACLLVIREHYCVTFSMPRFIGRFITINAGPVALFFVISGFLAYISLDRGISAKTYWKNRIRKIVPPYYIILVICIVYLSIMGKAGSDPMYLGWLRYFSFLNMLIPSYDFGKWNNIYGFWTMGCFPLFYFVAPYIYRKMSSFKNTTIIFLISIICMMGGRKIAEYIWQLGQFDDFHQFANIFPVSTLYLFVLGMMVAFACRRKCTEKMAAFLGMFLLGILAINKSGYVLWGCATGIILLRPSIKLVIENNKVWNTVIGFLDRNSFNMYLIHLLVCNIFVHATKSTSFLSCIIVFTIVLVLAELLSQLTKLLNKYIG